MTLRVGVVGGGRGLGPARMFDLFPDCKLVAVCDQDEGALRRCGEQFPDLALFTDYDRMLAEQLDIVVVGTPMPLHAEQTVAALKAGSHVLQEVTLADSMEGCRAILEAVRAHPKQKFMLAENCCYWAHILSWTEMWSQGLLGEFVYGAAEYVHDLRSLVRYPDGSKTWRASRPPIVYCTHSLGPLLKVTGERITSAMALHSGSRLEPEIGFIDFEVAIFRTSSGGMIQLLRGQAVQRKPAFHYYSLYGTKGCLETSRPPTTPLHTNAYFADIPHMQGMLQIPLTENVPGAPAAALAGGHGTAEYYMVRDFVESIRNDTRPPLDIHRALDMTLPGLCAHQSAEQGGTPVAVPDWRE